MAEIPDDFWVRLDEKFDRVHDKMGMIYGKVTGIDANGCAQRNNDIRRMDSIEGWKDSVTNKLVALLLAVIGSLGMAIYTLITQTK